MKKELMDTQDMGLAIALVCCGFQLIQLEKSGINSRVTFRFIAEEEIDQRAQEYWNGTLKVAAKLFWNESKNIKTRLYSLG